MKIEVTNLLNKPWPNAKVELFDTTKPMLEPNVRFTDINGVADFDGISIKGGNHLISITADNIKFEVTIKNLKKMINLKLPTIFGLLKKEITMDDNKFCNYCKFEYNDLLEKFKCGYCRKNYCSNHRLPENHKCTKLPEKPPPKFRELFAGSKVYVESK
jgi:hypothetical protein